MLRSARTQKGGASSPKTTSPADVVWKKEKNQMSSGLNGPSGTMD